SRTSGRIADLVEGAGTVQRERAARGSHQRAEVGLRADIRAEIAGQRADVGAGGAEHLDDGDRAVGIGAIPLDEVEPLELDLPRRGVDALAGAGPRLRP